MKRERQLSAPTCILVPKEAAAAAAVVEFELGVTFGLSMSVSPKGSLIVTAGRLEALLGSCCCRFSPGLVPPGPSPPPPGRLPPAAAAEPGTTTRDT